MLRSASRAVMVTPGTTAPAASSARPASEPEVCENAATGTARSTETCKDTRTIRHLQKRQLSQLARCSIVGDVSPRGAGQENTGRSEAQLRPRIDHIRSFTAGLSRILRA